jgi:hypothetical protein
MDGFLGERATLNKLDSGSYLLATNSTSLLGGIIVEEATFLDLTNQHNTMYDCYFKRAGTNITLVESQVYKKYHHKESNIESTVTIDSSGILNLGYLDASFAGILMIENTETLINIHNTARSPDMIILKPGYEQILTIDDTSPFLKLASGVVNMPVNGTGNGYAIVRNSIPFIVTELYAGV